PVRAGYGQFQLFQTHGHRLRALALAPIYARFHHLQWHVEARGAEGCGTAALAVLSQLVGVGSLPVRGTIAGLASTTGRACRAACVALFRKYWREAGPGPAAGCCAC